MIRKYINSKFDFSLVNITLTFHLMTAIFNFKIAIFDLDDTLWNGKTLFDDTRLILSTLKSSGVKMYVASYHTGAAECCSMLGIDKYFEEILYGREKSKLDMVNYIIEKNPTVDQREMVFFDDNYDNVMSVRDGTKVHVIRIEDTGIRWEYVANGRVATVPIVDKKLNIGAGYIKGADLFAQLDRISEFGQFGRYRQASTYEMEIDVVADFNSSDMARFSRAWMQTVTI